MRHFIGLTVSDNASVDKNLIEAVPKSDFDSVSAQLAELEAQLRAANARRDVVVNQHAKTIKRLKEAEKELLKKAKIKKVSAK